MVNNLDFLNKNAYRAYPIRQGSGVTSLQGVQLPQFLITSISLSVPSYSGALSYTPFVSQVNINNSVLTVGISLYLTYSSNTSTVGLGYFTGTITQDFQSCYFNPFPNSGADGFMTTGPLSEIAGLNATYTFTDICLLYFPSAWCT